ncbi:DUF4192 domain-containing protein [Nocardioides jensenii]|uniref:DUF4192 domain-containing protein n=1 Tax=Nocardioides jensenii TaxID=1843 RepID=UPI0009EA490F|nr:DUF4192 domain-containing protein [Nocardioides jensenii]
MNLVVKSQDELLAALPHVLGFKPEESIVVVPFGPGGGLPVVRADLPTSATERDALWAELRGPFSRHAHPDARIGIVCITADRHNTELASQHMSDHLETVEVTTDLRLWSDGEHWRDLNTGATGRQTQETVDKLAVKTVLTGVAQPAASRASLAESLVGDRQPIADVLDTARAASMTSTPSAERDWALGRLEQFHTDGVRLCDLDGARMLVALETISTRDALWQDMSTQNLAAHAALWTDLTRRAPDEVRAAPASMLGFASWLGGNGAKAWCALDQVPTDQPYTMADLVASALQNALHPREWEPNQTRLREVANELDESFVPKPPSHHDQRDVPASQPTDRPPPGL